MEMILFEERGQVGIITINRPKVLNALCSQVLDELNEFAIFLAVCDKKNTPCS